MDPNRIIAEFLSADKVVGNAVRWVLPPNTDTARADLVVFVPARPIIAARLHLTAHVHREPLKYGFSLMIGGARALGLDVNPGRWHTNFTDLGKVSIDQTHWQLWPNGNVEPDLRDRPHYQWFREFFRRGRIAFSGSYKGPPHLGGQQLRLL